MAALFVVIPPLFYFPVIPRRFNPLLLLSITLVVILLLLRRDPTFDTRRVWNLGVVRAEWKFIPARTAGLCALVGLGI